MYLNDPTTNQPSVSLTLLMVSFVGLVVAGGLELADKVNDASIFADLFTANAFLYFGRRFPIDQIFNRNKKEETPNVT